MRDENGNAWCDHYCQYTEMPTPGPLKEEVSALFDILYFTQPFDNLSSFVCQKR